MKKTVTYACTSPPTGASVPTIKRRTTTDPRPTPDMAAAFPDRTRPQFKNTSLNLPVELHAHLRTLAFQRNTVMKDLIVEAVEKAYPR